MIYLTGASGFVGRNLLPAILDSGYQVRALLLPDELAPLAHSRLQWVHGDVRHQDSLSGHLNDIDIVIHNAGIVASADETLNHEINYLGTRNILELAGQGSIRKFIYVSAAAVKFKSLNAYGRSKKRAEECVMASGLPYAILRLPLIIGPGGQEFEQFVKYVKALPWLVPVFGNGQAIKRPVYIDDAVQAVIALIKAPGAPNRIYEVSCREKLTLDQFIEAICQRLGQKKRKIHIPLGLALLLAKTAELIFGDKSPITKDILKGLNEDVEFEVEPSLAEMHLQPLSVAEALQKAIP